MKISKKKPKNMTPGQINKELDKLSKESSKLMDDFIEAGRGRERPSEYLKKSDPLSSKARALYDRKTDLQFEIKRRYGPNAPSRLPLRRGNAMDNRRVAAELVKLAKTLVSNPEVKAAGRDCKCE